MELTPPTASAAAESVRALRRLRRTPSPGRPSPMVREYERLSHGERTLLGAPCGRWPSRAAWPVWPARVARALRVAGSTVLVLDESDGARQAAAANSLRADVYLGLATAAAGTHRLLRHRWLRVPRRPSLADLLHEELAPVLGRSLIAAAGMRLPVLRETKMPAVLIELADQPRGHRPEPGRGRRHRACPRPLGRRPGNLDRQAGEGLSTGLYPGVHDPELGRYSPQCVLLERMFGMLSDQTIDPLKIFECGELNRQPYPCAPHGDAHPRVEVLGQEHSSSSRPGGRSVGRPTDERPPRSGTALGGRLRLGGHRATTHRLLRLPHRPVLCDGLAGELLLEGPIRRAQKGPRHGRP